MNGTAVQAVLLAVSLVATSHPSAVLRADNQEVAYKEMVEDLRLVARLLA